MGSEPSASANNERLEEAAEAVPRQQPEELTAVKSALAEQERLLRLALAERSKVEETLRALTETIPGFVHSAKPDGTIDYFNQRWLDYLGVSLDEITGWQWMSKLSADDAAAFLKKWRSSLATGQSFEAEARVRRADGKSRWMLFRHEPARDATGAIVKWCGLSLEIDNGKKAEDQLRRSEAYLTEAQRLSQTGSFGWIVETGELFWSRETFCILGYDPNTKPTVELALDRIHPDDRDSVKQRLDQATHEESKLDFEHRLLMPDGAVKHIHVLAKSAKTDAGKLEFIGAIMDITERKRIADALQASEHLARGQAERLNRVLRRNTGYLTEATELPQFLRQLLRETLELLEADGGHIFLYQKNDESFTYAVGGTIEDLHLTPAADEPRFFQDRFFADKLPVFEKLRAVRQAAILSRDGKDAPPPPELLEWFQRERFTEAVCLVLTAGEVPVGFIGAMFRRPPDLSPQKMDIFHALANQAALAIHLSTLADAAKRIALANERELVAKSKAADLEIEILARRRSEAYLAEAQRLSRTGSFGWNVATGEILWSEETYCVFGYDPATKPTLELILDRIYPEDRDPVQRTLDRAIGEESELDFEHRLLMPDGTIKHVHVLAKPTKTDASKLEFIGAVMDITERKQAAEALRASEHLARGQLDALVGTLAVLGREPKPIKFLEHVYQIACEHLGALGLVAWEISGYPGNIKLIANYQDGRLHLPTPEQMQVARPFGGNGLNPVWEVLFSSPEACAYGRITANPLRADIALSPDGPWHDSLNDFAGNPVMEKRLEQSAQSGIVANLILPSATAGKVDGFHSFRFNRQRRFRQEEIDLARAMVRLGTIAYQLYRLSEESREAAVTGERNRLAREIHDTLAQGFTGVIMQLEAAKDAMQRQDWPVVLEHVERAGKQARVSLGEARRSVVALRPHAVREKHLRIALDELLRRLADGSRVHATLHIEGDERPFAVDWENNLLRIAQEALNNTLKHAKATTFRATLKYLKDGLEVQLKDDGKGFELNEPHDGFGLVGMRERVNGMKGHFSVHSAPGRGTEIRISLDLTPSWSASDDHAQEES